MKTLWINSSVTPPDTDYTQIFTTEDFKAEIDCNGLPNEIWFSVSNGYECAQYLVDYCSKNNYATPRYHLQQMDLEDARKIIYLIEDYNLNYIKEHGISEEELIKHFVEIIGNTNIEEIGSITYAINKHEKELEALLPLDENIKEELTRQINIYNADIISQLTTQLKNYDAIIKSYIDAKNFANESAIPTKVSQLENDSGYLTEQQDISGLALKSEIPTKVSQLENDSGYLTKHQDISKLANMDEVKKLLACKIEKGYVDEALTHKANADLIPFKISQLENDTKYIYVDQLNKILEDYATKTLVDEKIVNYAKTEFVLQQIRSLKENYFLINKEDFIEDGNYKIVIENGEMKLEKE